MSKSLSRSRLGRTFRGTEEQSRSSETPAASASGPFHHPARNRRSSDSMQSQFPRLSRSSPPPPVWKHAGESRNSGGDRPPERLHVLRFLVCELQRRFL